MSAVRLYLLDALSREPAHGHQLRLLAQEEHAELWTDLQVGGIYGTLKRLADDGLIEAVRTEREGNRPERTVYAITGEGRDALAVEHHEMLNKLVFRSDPFDLALSRAFELPEKELRAVITARRAQYAAREAGLRDSIGKIAHRLSPAERQVTEHLLRRLALEVAWHDDLLEDVPALTEAPVAEPLDREV